MMEVFMEVSLTAKKTRTKIKTVALDT